MTGGLITALRGPHGEGYAGWREMPKEKDYEKIWVGNQKNAKQLDREHIAVQIIDHPDWSDEQIADTLRFGDLERDQAKDLVLVADVRCEIRGADAQEGAST